MGVALCTFLLLPFYNPLKSVGIFRATKLGLASKFALLQEYVPPAASPQSLCHVAPGLLQQNPRCWPGTWATAKSQFSSPSLWSASLVHVQLGAELELETVYRHRKQSSSRSVSYRLSPNILHALRHLILIPLFREKHLEFKPIITSKEAVDQRENQKENLKIL